MIKKFDYYVYIMYFYTVLYIIPFIILTNIHIIMKVSKEIREKILNDNDFSLDIAKLFKIQQYSVKELAKRNSDKLVLFHAVEFYKKKGFTDEQIFEPQNESE